MRRATSPAICLTSTRSAPCLDAHRHLLVLEARLVGRGVQELAGVVVHEAHRARHRVPVHVHVEDVHEDRDPERPAVQERRLIDLGDHDHAAIGGRDHDVAATRAGAFGIAEEVRDPEREDDQHER